MYFLLKNHIFARSLLFDSSECWTAAWFDVIVVRSLDVCPIHSIHKYTHTFSTSCAFNFICSLASFMSKQNILIKCANGMYGHGKTNEQVSEMNDYGEGREWIACSIHDNPISLCVHTFTEWRSSDQYSKTLSCPFGFFVFKFLFL